MPRAHAPSAERARHYRHDLNTSRRIRPRKRNTPRMNVNGITQDITAYTLGYQLPSISIVVSSMNIDKIECIILPPNVSQNVPRAPSETHGNGLFSRPTFQRVIIPFFFLCTLYAIIHFFSVIYSLNYTSRYHLFQHRRYTPRQRLPCKEQVLSCTSPPFHHQADSAKG